MNSILGVEIAGNSIWIILILFAIVLISLLVGKTVKIILKKSGERFRNQQRIMAATTLDALAKSSAFLFASIGISVGLILLEFSPNFIVKFDAFFRAGWRKNNLCSFWCLKLRGIL